MSFIPDIPFYVNIVFGLTTFITTLIFIKATHFSKISTLIIFIWLVLQAIIGISGFYTVTDVFPPRFAFLLLPALLTIIIMFTTARGRKYIDALDLQTLTWLHTVRIAVEIVLFWLFIHKAVPELMTFEGRNFDILSGITAPIIAYWGISKKRFGKGVILFWNFICLGLLFNIVIHGVLSVPSPFQKLAFKQPNVAVLYFPFIWLPCFVVPAVLFSHLVTVRQLLVGKNEV